ncbi:hypothetical protein [Jannaschia donghaensis]|uniref:Uncharacterized protein n=1 Tax=Jannaschia donghaensis TaxID=420998 RepID=A0A0M6YFE4_9RHOB|nr:hypothetical protein [Jannaschia donghaensis]CTQ49082.1 hypothetical protein JDO7802_01092 [Jannaschia donghaensis]
MSLAPPANRSPAIAAPVAPVTNAEKARALIAMLEPGQAAPEGVSPERLRDWANDLIRTVEGEAPKAPPPRRRRLFTKAPPTLSTPVSPQPTGGTPTSPASRLNLTAPMPHRPQAQAGSGVSTDPSVFAAADVTRIVDATLDRATLAREHPAIIAMTLLGKPSMDQASALRSLPGGQVRAVHRALRQLEAR